MTESNTVGTAPDDYDAMHHAAQNSPLLHELWARAMGDEYPLGVEPTSCCSWWLLGHAVAALRLRPGARLVDLGCGRGGPGLWLARALSVRLIGIDFSAAAIEIAAQRADDFVTPDRAEFRQGSFEQTGLPDEYADGLLSVDALPFSPDRQAALREASRILAPGGRFVLTAREQPADVGSWPTMATAAGFDVELVLPNTEHDDFWRRLFASYPENAAALRAELGERAANNLMLEAEIALAKGLPKRQAQLLVLRRRDTKPAA
ncbi:class I SAM-dependent methyltransferase [Actinoplanes sp. NPDC023801]|uniref:class I SAM-dependent methyltransferase n=1 Tax=Actinoplanes sp. NPDC023801 TaxID=3154595 RepID=UPI0033DC6140